MGRRVNLKLTVELILINNSNLNQLVFEVVPTPQTTSVLNDVFDRNKKLFVRELP